MNILVVSASFITRESLENVFKYTLNIGDVVLKERLSDLTKEELLNAKLIFIELEERTTIELDLIKYVKLYSKNTKVIVLDRNKSEFIFTELVQSNVDGYIFNVKDKSEFIHNIENILRGKKVFESDLIENIVHNKYINNMKLLTKRENEVLEEMAKGLNNKEIANNLYITEYTVKKHVSNIFSKLGFKNRQEAIISIASML
ncbi:fimbria biosynthesis transcriptional regulator FimZ [Paraclostridium ghonii]|uniref:DNA-binding NarL/FixJ family response regulator n=1 Tax=Paraclostridium ghonii TaxID=29358 RepID=A0ABU0MWE2_9FIRM|nr:response regulator transcription factor [Paeniclostridium ghonii]MDQ0555224.1 DNA-binding NarL/FixJ family response regulator [Paeniclostridium ghonii]